MATDPTVDDSSSGTIKNSTTGMTIDPTTGLPTSSGVTVSPATIPQIGTAGSPSSSNQSSSNNQVIDPATGLANTSAAPLANPAPVAPVAAPTVTPMTSPYTKDDASVASNMTGLLSQDSPYLQAAQTGAMQTAQSRGLLNSSIAAGAGEQAAINAALPIASQDASVAAAANLSAQGATQSQILQVQQLAQQAALQGQSLTVQQVMQVTGLNATQAQTILQGQINSNMQNTQILANALTAGNANANQLNIANLQAAVSFNSQLVGLTQAQITANTNAGNQMITGITANQNNTAMNQADRDTANAALLATYQAQVAAGDAYAKAARDATNTKAATAGTGGGGA